MRIFALLIVTSAQTQISKVKHVFIIIMENHNRTRSNSGIHAARVQTAWGAGLRIRALAQELGADIFCPVGCQFTGQRLGLDNRSKCVGIGSQTTRRPVLLQQLRTLMTLSLRQAWSRKNEPAQ